jgi:hypothetical protein
MMAISDAEAESPSSPVTQESDWFRAIKDGNGDRVRRLLADVADSEECVYLRAAEHLPLYCHILCLCFIEKKFFFPSQKCLPAHPVCFIESTR